VLLVTCDPVLATYFLTSHAGLSFFGLRWAQSPARFLHWPFACAEVVEFSCVRNVSGEQVCNCHQTCLTRKRIVQTKENVIQRKSWSRPENVLVFSCFQLVLCEKSVTWAFDISLWSLSDCYCTIACLVLAKKTHL